MIFDDNVKEGLFGLWSRVNSQGVWVRGWRVVNDGEERMANIIIYLQDFTFPLFNFSKENIRYWNSKVQQRERKLKWPVFGDQIKSLYSFKQSYYSIKHLCLNSFQFLSGHYWNMFFGFYNTGRKRTPITMSMVVAGSFVMAVVPITLSNLIAKANNRL